MLKEYRVNNDKNIFDVAIELYGDVSYALELLVDNNLALNDDLTGIVIQYNSIKKEETLKVKAETEDLTGFSYRIREGQTVFDLAIQLYGSIEHAFKIIQGDGISSLNNVDLGGVLIEVEYTDDLLAKEFSRRGTIINTGKVEFIEEVDGIFNNTFDLTFN